jgi:hypothetical protein
MAAGRKLHSPGEEQKEHERIISYPQHHPLMGG